MQRARQVLEQFKGIKTLPHVAIRLSKLISDEATSMAQFEEVIRMDPTLVMRLLHLVNSPYYGLRQKVKNIPRAVVYIGMKNLRNMIVLEALKEIFKNSSNGEVFSRSRLWLHSAAVGICSQMISERIFMKKGEDAFLCGILHDIGLIVEDQVSKEQFTQVCSAWESNTKPFVEYEKEIIGANHCEIGYFLAEDWKFSSDIQQSIRQHHNAMEAVDPESLMGVIQVAEYIVSKMDYTAIQGMQAELSISLTAHIRDNLMEYKAMTEDLPKEMAKAEDLYKSGLGK